ncbi:MAG: hypothetical protein RRB13_16205 [bacterium]|nr:hypothetical protein [bacterium]
MNLGEEICGEWLRHERGCDFIQYNIPLNDEQGEIDVVGINLESRTVYACEVAIHLETGLQYVKERQPDNVNRFVAKFGKDIRYIRKAFPEAEGYKHVVMLWTPIVRNSPNAKNNQTQDLKDIETAICTEFGVTVAMVVNREYQAALESLRAAAKKETAALESPVMRLYQIEEKLKRHLAKF